MTFSTIDNPGVLDWMKRTHRLEEKLDGSNQLFGPFHARSMLFHVRYQAEAGTWELGHPVDDYFAAYPARRDSIVALANEHRDSMGRDELVRFLIQAAIATGINKRVGILDTVELAANLEAVQRSIDTDAEYTSIPTEFDAAFIAATLDRGRGTRGGRGLWWVDDGKLYRLY